MDKKSILIVFFVNSIGFGCQKKSNKSDPINPQTEIVAPAKPARIEKPSEQPSVPVELPPEGPTEEPLQKNPEKVDLSPKDFFISDCQYIIKGGEVLTPRQTTVEALLLSFDQSRVNLVSEDINCENEYQILFDSTDVIIDAYEYIEETSDIILKPIGLSVLGNLPRLERIRLTGEIDNISFINESKSLTSLTIIASNLNEKTREIKDFQQLNELILEGSLDDIAFLTDLPNL